jgi:hypothetical protein
MMIEDIVGNAVARLPFNNRGSETIRLTPRAECFVRAFKDNPEGGVLEIGVLEGITSLMFMDLMHKLDDLRPMQAIDCYDINIEPGYQDEYFSTFRKMLNKAECMGREFVWRLFRSLSLFTLMVLTIPLLSLRR